MDFHIHLNSRNTLLGTRYFEVHIAREVLCVGDVAEDIWRLAVHHQTHRNTGYWAL